MIYIGIDPGVHGGIAYLHENELDVRPMPIIGDKEYNIQEMKNILKEFNLGGYEIFALIENQHPMPGEGLPRTFKTGMGFGILQGLLSGLEIPYAIISAKAWQREVFKGLPFKQDTKVSSGIIATRTFPKTRFYATERSRTVADGMTDAACIALYNQRFHGKNGGLLAQEQACIHRVLEANPHVCINCGDIL